jgi:hypothetical protein
MTIKNHNKHQHQHQYQHQHQHQLTHRSCPTPQVPAGYPGQPGMFLDMSHMAMQPGGHGPVLLGSAGFQGHYLQQGPPGHPGGSQLMHFPGVGYLPVTVGMQQPGQEPFAGPR